MSGLRINRSMLFLSKWTNLQQKDLAMFSIPRYDSNNIVLIEDNGNPTGNRITAPLPNVIRPILQKDSNPKKADYTKLFAIGTRWI